MSEPRPRPPWARTFTLEELPEQYRSALDRLAKFVEPEHGPAVYARTIEEVTADFLEWLNHRPSATRVRDQLRLDPRISEETKVELVTTARLHDAWLKLQGPYRNTIRKFDEAENEAFVARKKIESPSGKLAAEFAERLGEGP